MNNVRADAVRLMSPVAGFQGPSHGGGAVGQALVGRTYTADTGTPV